MNWSPPLDKKHIYQGEVKECEGRGCFFCIEELRALVRSERKAKRRFTAELYENKLDELEKGRRERLEIENPQLLAKIEKGDADIARKARLRRTIWFIIVAAIIAIIMIIVLVWYMYYGYPPLW